MRHGHVSGKNLGNNECYLCLQSGNKAVPPGEDALLHNVNAFGFQPFDGLRQLAPVVSGDSE